MSLSFSRYFPPTKPVCLFTVGKEKPPLSWITFDIFCPGLLDAQFMLKLISLHSENLKHKIKLTVFLLQFYHVWQELWSSNRTKWEAKGGWGTWLCAIPTRTVLETCSAASILTEAAQTFSILVLCDWRKEWSLFFTDFWQSRFFHWRNGTHKATQCVTLCVLRPLDAHESHCSHMHGLFSHITEQTTCGKVCFKVGDS